MSIPFDEGMLRCTTKLCGISFVFRIVFAILVCRFWVFRLSDILEGRDRADCKVVGAFRLVWMVL